MELTLIGLIATALTTAISTTVGLFIKHIYNKQMQEEKEKVAKEQEKVAEEKKKRDDQRKEYEKLLEEEKMRNYRKMVLEEIEPLVEELHRVKDKLKTTEEHLEHDIQDLKHHHDEDKDIFDKKIDTLISKHAENFERIVESYKFRFIQLCKTYLRDGYITTSEWEQLTTLFNLYHELGGNGQAEDYFEQIKKLEIIPDNE